MKSRFQKRGLFDQDTISKFKKHLSQPVAQELSSNFTSNKNFTKKFLLFIKLGRPKFLFYSLVLQAIGAITVIRAGGRMNFSIFFWGQIFIWAIHLMTHYCNEYFDLATDKINNSKNNWTGGSRVLVEGHFRPEISLYTALLLGSFGIFLQMIVPIFMPEFGYGRFVAFVMIIWAWEYSAPPLKLHSRGLGEVTVAGIVTGLTPLYGALLQTSNGTQGIEFYKELGLTLIPIMLTQVGRMMVMNIPDVEADQTVEKNTLVVIIGIPLAIKLYLFIQFVVLGILPILKLVGLPGPVVLAFVACWPIGVWQGYKLARGDWKSPEKLKNIPFACTIHVFLNAFLVMAGFMISSK